MVNFLAFLAIYGAILWKIEIEVKKLGRCLREHLRMS